MSPEITVFPETKLIGKSKKMNLANNKTFELWNSFMINRKEIKNNVSSHLFSIQFYDHSIDFNDFNEHTLFVKWAAIEVSHFDIVPNDMETCIIPKGLYAVFTYKGSHDTFAETFNYIFKTWLPNSDYQLDQRPHFELLGEKYKNNDPNSEEQIWVPIRLK
jgi:AraC family transcriptional regulator